MSDIHPTQHPLDGKLEPETKDCFDDRAPLYSIAISLKRIADAMDGGDPSYTLDDIEDLRAEIHHLEREFSLTGVTSEYDL